MAWPFSGIAAPTLDSDFVPVPTSKTLVPGVTDVATDVWALGIRLVNRGNKPAIVRLFNGSDVEFGTNFPLQPGEVKIEHPEFMPVTGLQWAASVEGVVGKVWGYK